VLGHWLPPTTGPEMVTACELTHTHTRRLIERVTGNSRCLSIRTGNIITHTRTVRVLWLGESARPSEKKKKKKSKHYTYYILYATTYDSPHSLPTLFPLVFFCFRRTVIFKIIKLAHFEKCPNAVPAEPTWPLNKWHSAR